MLSISGDGRIVAFGSTNSSLSPPGSMPENLVVRDRTARTTVIVDLGTAGQPTNGNSHNPMISRNGRYVAFTSTAADLVAGDTNRMPDVFVRDLLTGTTVRASVKSSGAEIKAPPHTLTEVGAISADGRFVVFDTEAKSVAPNARHRNVLVRDLVGRDTWFLTGSVTGGPPDGESTSSSISGDGRFVGFLSEAGKLVVNDANGTADAFVHDRKATRTTLVSVATGGAQGTGRSRGPYVADDGNIVAFTSAAPNLVPGDTNGAEDAFVRDIKAGTTVRVSSAPAGTQGNGTSRVTGI
jgi:Tol biopolymer transport system component